jgi:murein L,D-transpeptidase YafK
MFTKSKLFSVIMLFSAYIGAQIPSSTRSKAVLKKQTAILSKSLNENSLKIGNAIFIRIFKESKELELWMQKTGSKEYRLFKTYEICTYGSKGLGPKLKEGDQIAPEGFYYVPKTKMNPNSEYHLAFNLGYPNSYDLAHGRTGSLLMVHGNCVSIGCFAMTDPAIEEIYTLAHYAFENGQAYFRVHCFPFRMTEKKLQAHQLSEWYKFWKNLKEGYDFFEKNKFPPNVNVQGKRYIFK